MSSKINPKPIHSLSSLSSPASKATFISLRRRRSLLLFLLPCHISGPYHFSLGPLPWPLTFFHSNPFSTLLPSDLLNMWDPESLALHTKPFMIWCFPLSPNLFPCLAPYHLPCELYAFPASVLLLCCCHDNHPLFICLTRICPLRNSIKIFTPSRKTSLDFLQFQKYGPWVL